MTARCAEPRRGTSGPSRIREPGWIPLLAAVLSDAPGLPGARCVGLGELFDAEHADPELIERAINLCRGCPSLEPCSTWADSLPKSKRPAGVIAGRINPRPKGRPRKETA